MEQEQEVRYRRPLWVALSNHAFNIVVGVLVIVLLPRETNWFLELFIIISVMGTADKIHFWTMERAIFQEWARHNIRRK